MARRPQCRPFRHGAPQADRREHGSQLEAYRASDGSHLGAFDHETGQQVSQARKNRSIKKYL
nr:colicin E3/pyocin S6 family cytotoxin [Pseudomonas sp. P97.38]